MRKDEDAGPARDGHLNARLPRETIPAATGRDSSADDAEITLLTGNASDGPLSVPDKACVKN
jgi:hypothetical protein